MLLLVGSELTKMVIALSTCLVVSYRPLRLGQELWVVGQGRQRYVHLCVVRVPNEATLYLDKLLHWVRCSRCCILLQVLLLLLLLLLLGHVLLLGRSTLLLLKLKLLLLVLLLLTCLCSGRLKLLLA